MATSSLAYTPLAGADLLDSFQRWANDRRSGVLQCECPLGAGLVWLRNGRIMDSEFEGLRGEAAVLCILALRVGSYRFHAGDTERAPRIRHSTNQLGEAYLEHRSELERIVGGLVRAGATPALRQTLHQQVEQLSLLAGSTPQEDARARQPAAAEARPTRDSERPVPERGRQGQRIGRYEVLSRIGRGGMGTVYRVHLIGDGGFSRPFALKVLRSHLAENEQAVQSLLAEARIAAKLSHANVVSVVDLGSYGEQPYVVMEYVHGPSLADLLAANSPKASPRLIVTVILDALAGLSAVHTASDVDGTPLGIIHNDISPHNFLVGADGVCRLTDFGIASIPNRSGKPSEQGKPGYMSPERVQGKRVDARSDVFSMGVLMWTALTRAKLFEASDVQRTLQNVLTASVPPPSVVSGSPECLDAICMKALKRGPQERFESAQAMGVELRRRAIAADLLDSPAGVSEWVRAVMGDSVETMIDASPEVKPRSEGPRSIPDAASLDVVSQVKQPDFARARSRASAQNVESAAFSPAQPRPKEESSAPRLPRIAQAVIVLLAIGALVAAIVAPE